MAIVNVSLFSQNPGFETELEEKKFPSTPTHKLSANVCLEQNLSVVQYIIISQTTLTLLIYDWYWHGTPEGRVRKTVPLHSVHHKSHTGWPGMVLLQPPLYMTCFSLDITVKTVRMDESGQNFPIVYFFKAYPRLICDLIRFSTDWRLIFEEVWGHRIKRMIYSPVRIRHEFAFLFQLP